MTMTTEKKAALRRGLVRMTLEVIVGTAVLALDSFPWIFACGWFLAMLANLSEACACCCALESAIRRAIFLNVVAGIVGSVAIGVSIALFAINDQASYRSTTSNPNLTPFVASLSCMCLLTLLRFVACIVGRRRQRSSHTSHYGDEDVMTDEEIVNAIPMTQVTAIPIIDGIVVPE